MRKNILFNIVLLLTLPFLLSSQTTTLPYFCGFEDDAENANWTLNPVTGTNIQIPNNSC